MTERQRVLIESELLESILKGENRGGRPTILKLEDDGSLRAYCLQVGLDPDGRERIELVEADATPRMQLVLWETTTPGPIRWRAEPALGEATASLYGTSVSGNIAGIENEDTGELRTVNLGWDGAAVIRLLTEADGSLRTSLLGSDEAGNLDSVRTDPDRIPWQRPYSGYVQVDPVEIPAAEGILWNPGAAAAELYEVSFLVVNNDAGAAPVTVSVGVDIAAAGALAAPGYWMFNEVVPYPGSSGWRGPFLIAGDDDVRGVASVANDASIHFRVRRCDLGA